MGKIGSDRSIFPNNMNILLYVKKIVYFFIKEVSCISLYLRVNYFPVSNLLGRKPVSLSPSLMVYNVNITGLIKKRLLGPILSFSEKSIHFDE